MVGRTTDLDERRGVIARKETELRRLRLGVKADQDALRARQEELEAHLVAAPANDWAAAVEKVRYLLDLMGPTLLAQDARRQRLIEQLNEDFDRLLAGHDEEPDGAPSRRNDLGDTTMPRGEQRGNRESKKPKKEKPKTTAAAAPSAMQPKASAPPRPAGKK
jgi:hypothetical protein